MDKKILDLLLSNKYLFIPILVSFTGVSAYFIKKVLGSPEDTKKRKEFTLIKFGKFEFINIVYGSYIFILQLEDRSVTMEQLKEILKEHLNKEFTMVKNFYEDKYKEHTRIHPDIIFPYSEYLQYSPNTLDIDINIKYDFNKLISDLQNHNDMLTERIQEQTRIEERKTMLLQSEKPL